MKPPPPMMPTSVPTLRRPPPGTTTSLSAGTRNPNRPVTPNFPLMFSAPATPAESPSATARQITIPAILMDVFLPSSDRNGAALLREVDDGLHRPGDPVMGLGDAFRQHVRRRGDD